MDDLYVSSAMTLLRPKVGGTRANVVGGRLRSCYWLASLTDILARKSARVGKVSVQVGEDRRACPARGKLNGEVAGHADILATILARKSARMSVSVSVSVSVPWNSSLTRHLIMPTTDAIIPASSLVSFRSRTVRISHFTATAG